MVLVVFGPSLIAAAASLAIPHSRSLARYRLPCAHWFHAKRKVHASRDVAPWSCPNFQVGMNGDTFSIKAPKE